MAEVKETSFDVIAEIRDLAANRDWHNHTNQSNRERVSDIADRLEAALKRERATAKNSSAVGDAAKLREALEFIKLASDDYETYGTTKAGALDVIYEKACAALAEPQRNCERFNSGDPVKDADDAYAEWQRWCDAADMPPSCKVESAFRQWLFATAKPNAKGDAK